MKKWTSPQLIALVRSDPQEAVLSACKNGSPTDALISTSPANHHAMCRSTPPPPGPGVSVTCDTCSVLLSS